MFCRNCGEDIPIDSVFCPHCGKNLLEIESPPPGRSRARPGWWAAVRHRLALNHRSFSPDAERPSAGNPRWSSIVSVMKRLTLFRVLWCMGLVFAAAGFLIAVSGAAAIGLDWLVFGLVLVVAAPYAPGPVEPNQQQEMRD